MAMLRCAMILSITAVSCAGFSQVMGTATKVEAAGSKSKNKTAAKTKEYTPLKTKWDWRNMARVTFSENGIRIKGKGCSDEGGVLYITEGGAYKLTGESDSASIIVDTDEDVKLILNGVDLTSAQGPVIYGKQAKHLYVETGFRTINNLTDSDYYDTDSYSEEIGDGVISCEDDLVILGSGTLDINGNHKHGITSDDNLYIESGRINISTTGSDGLYANELICVDGGRLNIESASDVMEAEDMLVVNGGIIKASSDYKGFQSKNKMYIYGGEITIDAEDDGLNAASYIEIDGGTTNIKCSSGDAIDCGGNTDGCIVINGGYLYAAGGQFPEAGIDSDEASPIINGGTVIIIGEVNSPISRDGKQVTVVYGSFEANKKLEIKNARGRSLFKFTPEISGTTMIISAKGMRTDQNYKIYAGGEEAYEFTVDSQVIEAGGVDQGMEGIEPPEGFEQTDPTENWDTQTTDDYETQWDSQIPEKPGQRKYFVIPDDEQQYTDDQNQQNDNTDESGNEESENNNSNTDDSNENNSNTYDNNNNNSYENQDNSSSDSEVLSNDGETSTEDSYNSEYTSGSASSYSEAKPQQNVLDQMEY